MKAQIRRLQAQDNREKEQAKPVPEPPTASGRWSKWLKRIGVGGFLFFLIKGLLWLVIFYWLGKHV